MGTKVKGLIFKGGWMLEQKEIFGENEPEILMGIDELRTTYDDDDIETDAFNEIYFALRKNKDDFNFANTIMVKLIKEIKLCKKKGKVSLGVIMTFENTVIYIKRRLRMYRKTKRQLQRVGVSFNNKMITAEETYIKILEISFKESKELKEIKKTLVEDMACFDIDGELNYN